MSGPEIAVLCSKCGASLPEGSQFCLKCGQAVTALSNRGRISPVVTPGTCSECGATLPDAAQFCLKCGRPATSLAKSATIAELPAIPAAPLPQLTRSRHKRPLIIWAFAALLTGLFLWAATSDNSVAQDVQEFFGWKRDQAILETPFSIAAQAFQSFKFDLPEGSVNVSVVGDFASTSDNHENSPRKSSNRDKNQAKAISPDNNIEVFVLTESAFAVWQNGYSTGTLYESGRVAAGTVQADLPPGAGVYYLVFSNKFSPKTKKNIDATVFLRYRTWLPESIRRIKARILNWID